MPSWASDTRQSEVESCLYLGGFVDCLHGHCGDAHVSAMAYVAHRFDGALGLGFESCHEVGQLVFHFGRAHNR